MRISLNGEWEMKRASDSKTFRAEIPGTDFGALIKAGEIKNPLVSGVEDEALKTASDNYSFKRKFNVAKEELEKKNVRLECGCIDTLCDCVINGKRAFSLSSAYIPVCEDIKKYLTEGENEIEFSFASPYNYIKKKYEQHPLVPNSNGVNGIPYIRKPGCHFGWDWGPCVPYCGILDDIYIECLDKPIEKIAIKQSTTKEKSVVKATADGAETIYMLTPDGKRLDGENGEFIIENPELWYTYELSQKETQPLYTVVFENGEVKTEKKIGLRSLYLDTSKDEYGYQFRFVLNGEPVFSKGANLIPFSALFEDTDCSTVDYYMNLARKSNYNMLRVWGGGTYASDYLLEKCDEMGILIWQDFCFACQLYPLYDEQFKALVMKEVEANVRRMDTHPSVALWCGNNEIEQMFGYLPKSSKLIKAYIQFSYVELKDKVASLTEASFIPSSPYGTAPFENTSSDDVGDTHMWNVWHGLKKLDYYQQRFTRFMSEFGLEALPSMKAIKTFAQKKDFSMSSKPFMNHQKCTGGNQKMLFYLTEMFDFPKHFEALPYLTGIVQSECVKNAAVHFRQNKGRCNGCLYWQYNDVWNCPSWSSVDFEGVPKALQYNARDFYSPVAVTCQKENGEAAIYAHNDTLYPIKLDVKLEYFNMSGEKLREEKFDISLEKNSHQHIRTAKTNPKEVLRISWGNRSITEIFSVPAKMKLQKADIRTEFDGDSLKVSSDTFAYNIFIESDSIANENYFSLMKGETKTVTFDRKPEEINVICANNIEFIHKPIRKKMFRALYRMKLGNIARAIGYAIN